MLKGQTVEFTRSSSRGCILNIIYFKTTVMRMNDEKVTCLSWLAKEARTALDFVLHEMLTLFQAVQTPDYYLFRHQQVFWLLDEKLEAFLFLSSRRFFFFFFFGGKYNAESHPFLSLLHSASIFFLRIAPFAKILRDYRVILFFAWYTSLVRFNKSTFLLRGNSPNVVYSCVGIGWEG